MRECPALWNYLRACLMRLICIVLHAASKQSSDRVRLSRTSQSVHYIQLNGFNLPAISHHLIHRRSATRGDYICFSFYPIHFDQSCWLSIKCKTRLAVHWPLVSARTDESNKENKWTTETLCVLNVGFTEFTAWRLETSFRRWASLLLLLLLFHLRNLISRNAWPGMRSQMKATNSHN